MSSKNLFNVSLDGNNNKTTRESYRLKKFYEDTILPDQYFTYKFDSWKNNNFYGKIDNDNDSVIIHDGYTKPIGRQAKINVLDFVADAYNDMQAYYLDLAKNGARSNLGGVYGSLEPVSGYSSIYSKYDLHMESLYQIFFDTFKNELLNEVRSFEDFIEIFLYFVSVSANITCITRSSFVTSNRTNILDTGLAVELTKDYRYDDDASKINVFIENSEFDLVFDVAKRFGFMIDKNAPWRLVADITSPALQKYMFAYSLTDVEKVFAKRFYKAYVADIDILKFYMKQFWNAVVRTQPTVSIPKKVCGYTVNELYERKEMKDNQVAVKASDYYFNRLYVFLKAQENKMQWSQQDFENYVRNANEIFKYKGKESSYQYINSLFNGYENLIRQKSSLTGENPDGKMQVALKQTQSLNIKF